MKSDYCQTLVPTTISAEIAGQLDLHMHAAVQDNTSKNDYYCNLVLYKVWGTGSKPLRMKSSLRPARMTLRA